MNDAIRIKIAEAEEWEDIEHGVVYVRDLYRFISGEKYHIPSYDNDNDLDRFIRGMGDRQYDRYYRALHSVTSEKGAGAHYDPNMRGMFCATEEQKQDAIIEAYGWEDLKCTTN